MDDKAASVVGGGRPEKLRQRWRHRRAGEVVIVDNRDSFVFNLAHRLAQVGATPVVARSDEVTVEQIAGWSPAAIVLSPGPGHPDEAGCSVEVVRQLGEDVPILGVCLGHQAIGRAFGATVAASGRPMHGQASVIEHDGEGIFAGLGERATVEVARYHSLHIEEPLPPELRVTARGDGMVMALRHTEWPIIGVQFHPESVLTPQGLAMLANFMKISA